MYTSPKTRLAILRTYGFLLLLTVVCFLGEPRGENAHVGAMMRLPETVYHDEAMFFSVAGRSASRR